MERGGRQDGRRPRRRARRRHRGAPGGPGAEELRALPRGGHPVRVAARLNAAPRRHVRSGAAAPHAATAPQPSRLQGVVDLLVRRGARPQRTGGARAEHVW